MLGFKLVILARYRMKPGEICAAVDLFEWAMVVRGSGIKGSPVRGMVAAQNL